MRPSASPVNSIHPHRLGPTGRGPVIRAAIERDVMILEDCWFDEAAVPIYRKYVLALFARLAALDRTACWRLLIIVA